MIDPEARVALEQLLAAVPGGIAGIPDVVQRRAVFEALIDSLPAPANPGVSKQNRTIPGPSGDPNLPVRVYRPAGADGTGPGIVFIHGGAMSFGSLETEDAVATMLCDQLGAVVVSVGFRQAPENPYPAPFDDCYAGLVWTAANTAELGFAPGRLAIVGGSSGANLTIAVAMRARDSQGPSIRFIMPFSPMIDDTNTTASSHEITDIGAFDRSHNIECWAWYLGGRPADQYAAPARASDLAGLPPAFIDVGTVDVFRDEAVGFAQRLMAAGVPTELHVHPGAYHGAETFAPESALGRRIWGLRIDAVRRALA
ncbi:alpha/beta hydrolase [Actinoplanes sp. TBRC 11911]|uniref:alpha/beta hydrolase n=1 Tax=Actinoplanes sp. TBRC 11911 TaxID=2729386 RepID=UPI001B7D6404|nr:alpha/beta hydrolase [Actinoplanes sp. TBRC 11911]